MSAIRLSAFICLLAVGSPLTKAGSVSIGPADRGLLMLYAQDTWRSINAHVLPGGLPTDNLRRTGQGWIASEYTSPTNIAGYLWSTLAAESLGLIGPDEATVRITHTLEAVSRLERAHGFFFNWYDPRTGARLQTWPGTDVAVRPFLSSVDNGWLAAALMMVAKARPALREEAEAMLGAMDFGFFYNEYDSADPVRRPGLLHGGYWTDDGTYSEYHYNTLNTEPRIASYVGIARGEIPPEHYYRMVRALRAGGPDGQEEGTPPVRTYLGVPVVEGYVKYRGLRVVPSWDGSMFEAMMVPLLVPEADWAPQSWGINHPLYVRAQVEHSLCDTCRGFWGVSASCDPAGGYRSYGIAPLSARPRPLPPWIESGTVVTPHASFLALPFAPAEALANLKALATQFPAYTPFGFLDSVDVASGRVSDHVLVLDQSMIMASIANVLVDGVLQRIFSEGTVEQVIRPLIALETFEAGADRPATTDPVVGVRLRWDGADRRPRVPPWPSRRPDPPPTRDSMPALVRLDDRDGRLTTSDD